MKTNNQASKNVVTFFAFMLLSMFCVATIIGVIFISSIGTQGGGLSVLQIFSYAFIIFIVRMYYMEIVPILDKNEQS